MVKLLNDYDPHIMLDLHTTDGSRHSYHLTWETPNNPAADTGIINMARDEWLPAVTEAIRKKDGWALHSYGDVEGQSPERQKSIPTAAKRCCGGWMFANRNRCGSKRLSSP